MDTLELAAIPTVNEIVADLLAIMRRHTHEAGEGWNRATTLEQAGIDSFEFVQLIFDVEDLYRININFNSNTRDAMLTTVDDVARFVQTAIRRHRNAP